MSKPNLFKIMIVTCFVGGTAHAQSSPSLQDTISFLAQKANLQWTNSGIITRRQAVSVVSCEITFTANDYAAQDPLVETYSVSLSDLDPSKVYALENDWTDVRVSTKENKPLVAYEAVRTVRNSSGRAFWEEHDHVCNVSNQCIEAENINSFAFSVLSPREDNAPRVMRALAHLIELCGGEEELF